MGTDVSRHMLNVARDRDAEGDVHEHDMGHGLPFRPGVFDGAISISAVQWLCYAHAKAHVPSCVRGGAAPRVCVVRGPLTRPPPARAAATAC